MTEEEARAEAEAIAGSAIHTVERYADLLVAENGRQNVIANSTVPTLWSRHLLDSLQLARFARDEDRTWIDVGSGPGLPGLVLAALARWRMTLVEPRRRRAEFLSFVVESLGLKDVEVLACDIRAVTNPANVISARAVASVDRIFDLAEACTSASTRFILPKGRSAREDVDLAQARWQGLFHVEQSITDPGAGIVIADRVRRR